MCAGLRRRAVSEVDEIEGLLRAAVPGTAGLCGARGNPNRCPCPLVLETVDCHPQTVSDDETRHSHLRISIRTPVRTTCL